MNLSAPFVRRPIGTTLLTIGIALAGIIAYFQLPVSPLPQFDLPSIQVRASLPGASPENMATSVATPLEKRLGRLAGVTELTSRSGVGQTQIQLQFDLSRDIDGAARDVMAAVNAARSDMPSTMRSNPSYRKFNPSDQPVLILSMTSKTRTRTDIYDSAATIVQQQLSQVKGVGDVSIQGGALPAVRVELNPLALARYGIGLEDVRAAIAASNANRPKGVLDTGDQRFQIYTNDAGRYAKDYAGLVVAYRNGNAVRLSDVAEVVDGPSDIHNVGLVSQAGQGSENAVTVQVSRSPGANIIQTVDAVEAKLPALAKSIPPDIELKPVIDRSTTIRASLRDVETTLAISTVLVIAVVAFFLQSGGATLVPSVAVTVSLLGTIGVMFLLGFSLNNLSLMALTISTGFVVDDAIVVLENITRNIEKGMPRFQAALKGAQEVGFTVMSISVSLIAVFIPILLMGGILGRLFREFAISLTAAILISLLLSLTTTPMMCAYLIGRPKPGAKRNWFGRISDGSFAWMHKVYAKGLTWALASGPIVLAILVCTACLTVYLINQTPKGFFPDQDTGMLQGGAFADQSSSFQVSQQRLRRFVAILEADPAIQTVVANTGGNSNFFFQISLKPKNQRDPVEKVVTRLRPQLTGSVPGAGMFLNPQQDLRIGGRQSNATYQYTLQAQSLSELRTWAVKLKEAMQKYPALQDVNTDQEDRGLQTFITLDKDKLAEMGLTPGDVDNTLYDAFGQRQVTTIYNAQNQYSVVMEVAQQYAQDPTALQYIYIPRRAPAASATAFAQNAAAAALRRSTATGGVQSNTNTGAASNEAQAPPGRGASQGAAVSLTAKDPVPLAAIGHWADSATPTQVNHQDTAPATTISFNLAEGASLSDAQADVKAAQASIGMPNDVQGVFAGTAKTFQDSQSDQIYLIITAILAVYIVLGILYESYIHPLTVLSTLPPAGLGAVVALFLFHTEFSIIALIGMILLIGIVKKNAIMMIDFALEAERSRGLSSRDAIYEAAMIRFRPIMMTTFAAILGAIPLAVGWGEGAELRRPLGITIIGGLLVSQVLTLLTTPVVYMYLDRFRRRKPNESYLSRSGGMTPESRPGRMTQPRNTPDTISVNKPSMTRHPMRLPASIAGLTALGLVLAGCTVGPDYKRPEALPSKAPTPMAFKEADGWKQAAPSDAITRKDWWKVFNDPVLDDLEAKVLVSNQNLVQSEAAYRQALATLDQQRASLFPTVTGTGGGTNSKSPTGFTTSSGAFGGSRPIQTYTARLGLSWDIDVWGKVRRSIEAAKSTAQADAATLANATLSAQTLLAADYFQLRAADEQKRLLDETVKGYAEDLRIAQNRFNVGVGARSDVITAQTQLESAQASAVDLVRTRQQQEHAIAVLTGQAPSALTIEKTSWKPDVPAVPISLPTALLERRPDIAAAERQMQAANAQIGIQTAAYFPDLSISGQYGFQASTLQKLISATANSWSYGATLTQPIFDAGSISAKVRGSKAAYDSSVANYRQTVLTAFQGVEDNIAALRVLQTEYDIDVAASRDADEAERIANNQYQAGQSDFTTVVVAQNTALNARRTVLTTASSRLVALVDLVGAFGGGWSNTELAEVKASPLFPNALIP